MSQQRDDLTENELSKFAARGKEVWSRYGLQIVIGVAAVLVVGIGYFIYSSVTYAGRSERWTAYAKASSAEQFAEVADKYAGTPAGQWARLREIQGNLRTGIQAAFSNRETSKELISESVEKLQALMNTGPTGAARERALFMLGTALEVQNDGDPEEAVSTYQKLLSEFPDTEYAAIVKRRIEILEKDETKEFYVWFQEQNPTSDDRQSPNDRSPFPGMGNMPNIQSKPRLPNIPDLLDDTGLDLEGTSEAGPELTAPELTGPELTPETSETSDDENSTDENSDDENSDDDAPADDTTSDDEPDVKKVEPESSDEN